MIRVKTLKEYAACVEKALVTYTSGDYVKNVPDLLVDAMTYSLKAGGKRLRPCMLLAAVDMLGGNSEECLAYACAVEMIHTYSLIHDDLPGMDNDVLRRGRATNHVVYGEGQAILAGDGLLSLAMEIMLKDAVEHPEDMAHRTEAALEIIRGAGVSGMVGGQCLDLDCERRHFGGQEELKAIELGKTCCMFMYPMRAAACLCGASEEEKKALEEYARSFGRMFQIADDLLDVEGSAEDLGKSIGKDEKSGKLTAVGVYGLEGARGLVDEEMNNALYKISIFGEKAEFFTDLIKNMRGRKK